jgi:hypothetical protein
LSTWVLSSGHADRERLAVGGPEFDEVAAVGLRAVDHDTVLASYRRLFLPHSSSSSRFTAGATRVHRIICIGGYPVKSTALSLRLMLA